MIKRLPAVWCELIGTEIIDRDGFTDVEWNTPMSLTKFLERHSECTVQDYTEPNPGWEFFSR